MCVSLEGRGRAGIVGFPAPSLPKSPVRRSASLDGSLPLFAGESHPGPAHAMMHVERLSTLHALCQPRRPGPIFSRRIFDLEPHAHLAASRAGRGSGSRAPSARRPHGPRGWRRRGRGLAAGKWRLLPRALRGPRALVTAARRPPRPARSPRLLPQQPAPSPAPSAAPAAAGSLGPWCPVGAGAAGRAAHDASARRAEGPATAGRAPGICPASVSPAASGRRGRPVPGRGWPGGRGRAGRRLQPRLLDAGCQVGKRPAGLLPARRRCSAGRPRARGQVSRPGSVGKMATPGMSWQQHYYGGSAAGAAKFAPSPAAAQQAGHSLDYSQDLHLKMSKKIAQLTKVRARPRSPCLRPPARLPGREPARPAPVRAEGGCSREATAGDLAPRTLQTSGDTGDVNFHLPAPRHGSGCGTCAPLPFRGKPAQNKLVSTSFIAQ